MATQSFGARLSAVGQTLGNGSGQWLGRADYRWGVRNRQLAAGAAGVGIASMVATSLLQLRVLKHLPDPPLPGFDSDKVNLSPQAFPFGIPDGPLAAGAYVTALALAAWGPADRAKTKPWVPLAAGGQAAILAAVSGYYFYSMPAKEHAWCGYCILAALASFAIFGLALPEARLAARQVRGG